MSDDSRPWKEKSKPTRCQVLEVTTELPKVRDVKIVALLTTKTRSKRGHKHHNSVLNDCLGFTKRAVCSIRIEEGARAKSH